MATKTRFKALRPDGTSPVMNFDYKPYLPKGDKPGKWLPKTPKGYGYYVENTYRHAREWVSGKAIVFEVETSARTIAGNADPKYFPVPYPRIRLLRRATARKKAA